jgi:hypothetical protein
MPYFSYRNQTISAWLDVGLRRRNCTRRSSLVFVILNRLVIDKTIRLDVGIWTYGELPCRQGLGPTGGSQKLMEAYGWR